MKKAYTNSKKHTDTKKPVFINWLFGITQCVKNDHFICIDLTVITLTVYLLDNDDNQLTLTTQEDSTNPMNHRH